MKSAGAETAFCKGAITKTDRKLDPDLDVIGWYCGNSSLMTHDVAGKAANAWGLYDMAGNVREWTGDWNGSYPSDQATDPSGPQSGTSRAIRGEALSLVAQYARGAYRNYAISGSSDFREFDLGYRLARSRQP
jgi:formylglycine-generating enzyme required for sulfatase activity